MFIRRYYYDLSTGNMIYGYMLSGNINLISIEDEFRFNKALKGKTFENTGVFEWLEPDEEIESKMNGRFSVSVDISKTPHELVFIELPEPVIEEETEQLQ